MKFSDVRNMIDDGMNGVQPKQTWNMKSRKMVPIAILALVILILLVFSAGYTAGMCFNRATADTAGAAGLLTAMIVLIGISVLVCIFYVRALSKHINRFNDAAQNLAGGKIESVIETGFNGNLDGAVGEIQSIRQSILRIMDDVNMLKLAMENGELSARADAENYRGIYRSIVIGMNLVLDAVTLPAKETAKMVREMSEGNYDTRITGEYNGEFKIIKESINDLIDRMNFFVQDAFALACALQEGRLSARVDTEGHRGVYKKFFECMNTALDTVSLPLEKTVCALREVSKGNLDLNFAEEFKGDSCILRDSLVDTIDFLKDFISESTSALQRMSGGDLHVCFVKGYSGDFAVFKGIISGIAESLNSVIKEIKSVADRIVDGIKGSSFGTKALLKSAGEQASSVEELSSTISEINTQIQQNALNAEKANELSLAANDNASKGNEKIKLMLAAIRDIYASSSNISMIIKEIDAIAYQTNILSINASVEAAQAGIHGQSFAVVAQEVRQLAVRSAKAAKDTAELIENSIKKTETGMMIANETAEMLQNIAGSVDSAVNLVGQISAATSEQAVGIAQINKGIDQISQTVQNNVTIIQRAVVGIEDLSGYAEKFSNMFDRFKLIEEIGDERS